MRFSTGAALALALLTSSAHALTIDFEDGDRSLVRNSQNPDACIANVSIDTQGFNFHNDGLCSAYYDYTDLSGNPSIGLYFASAPGEYDASITMTRLDGQAFDLLGLDTLRGASRWSYLYGYREGTLVYSEYFYMNGFIEHQVLNWTDVDTVTFYKPSAAPNSFGFDNLQVNVVPIPAAVWLFGSALGVLGWCRRS